jgi:hypothetical protein
VRRLQSALLAHLADNLSSPDLQQVITAEFNNQLKVTYEERQKLQRLSTDTAESVERKRAELRRQIENAVQSLVMVGPSPALINLHQRLEQDLRALKPPSAEETDERQYTEEEVAEFLNQKLQDLRGVLAAEPELAKREMKHRIDKLILTPVETPEGRFYEISGDLRLLGAPESGVLDGSVHKLAQYSNFCLFPVSLRLPIDRRCGFKKAA